LLYACSPVADITDVVVFVVRIVSLRSTACLTKVCCTSISRRCISLCTPADRGANAAQKLGDRESEIGDAEGVDGEENGEGCGPSQPTRGSGGAPEIYLTKFHGRRFALNTDLYIGTGPAGIFGGIKSGQIQDVWFGATNGVHRGEGLGRSYLRQKT